LIDGGEYSNSNRKEAAVANFLFVLSKDDNQSVTRCFQFAQIAHSKGHQVDLFFIEDGVFWANSTRDMTQRTTTGDCPNDYLPYLVENEIPIGV
jgi:sulfur relay (sulfurtransferase) complex TusBCD TusD component (DsrE family)